jgi:hypothetical protein
MGYLLQSATSKLWRRLRISRWPSRSLKLTLQIFQKIKAKQELINPRKQTIQSRFNRIKFKIHPQYYSIQALHLTLTALLHMIKRLQDIPARTLCSLWTLKNINMAADTTKSTSQMFLLPILPEDTKNTLKINFKLETWMDTVDRWLWSLRISWSQHQG